MTTTTSREPTRRVRVRGRARHITPERCQLTALRRVSCGTVYNGRSANEYVDNGDPMPQWMASGMASAVSAGYVAFSAQTHPSGVAKRAELTVGGFIRVSELATRLDRLVSGRDAHAVGLDSPRPDRGHVLRAGCGESC